MAPTASVVKPEYHHEVVDHLLFTEPMTKKTIPVNSTDKVSECSVPNK